MGRAQARWSAEIWEALCLTLVLPLNCGFVVVFSSRPALLAPASRQHRKYFVSDAIVSADDPRSLCAAILNVAR